MTNAHCLMWLILCLWTRIIDLAYPAKLHKLVQIYWVSLCVNWEQGGCFVLRRGGIEVVLVESKGVTAVYCPIAVYFLLHVIAPFTFRCLTQTLNQFPHCRHRCSAASYPNVIFVLAVVVMAFKTLLPLPPFSYLRVVVIYSGLKISVR